MKRRFNRLAVPVLATLLTTMAHADSPTGPGEWRTWNGKSYRLEADGNLSCYSVDGTSCYGAPRPTTADAATDRPLVCGAAHLAKYGTTGYDTAGHWCNEAYANLFANWQHHGVLGFSTMMAFTPAGDAMCLSYDSASCQWGMDDRTQPDLGRIKPLVCGAPHQAVWGSTGYGNADHWCNSREILARQAHVLQAGGHPATLRLAMPAWTRADEPAWIVRANLPRDTWLEFGFSAWTSDTSSSLFGIQQTENDQLSLTRASTSTRVPMLHPDGPATFAIQVDANGRVRYQAAAGLVSDILSPARQVSITPLPPSDGSAVAASRPAIRQYEADPTAKLFLTASGSAPPTGEILEVIATRKRQH